MKTVKTYVVGQFCFLQHPSGERGHWARTDRCVAFVECPACGARPGEMCVGRSGVRTSNTHAYRRDKYQQLRQTREVDVPQKQATYIIIEELP
jgi:hypothetical protein